MKLVFVCAVLGVVASQYPGKVPGTGYSPPGSASPNAAVGTSPLAGPLPTSSLAGALGGVRPAVLIAASPGQFGGGAFQFPSQSFGVSGGRTGSRPSSAAATGQSGAGATRTGASSTGAASPAATSPAAGTGSTPNTPNTRLFGLGGNLAGGAASFLGGALGGGLGAGLANAANQQQQGFGLNQGFGGVNQGFGGVNQGFGVNPGFAGVNQGFGGVTPGFGGVNPGLGGINPGFGGVNPGFGGINPGVVGVNQGFGGINPGVVGVNQGFGGINPGVVGVNQGFGGINPGLVGVNQGLGGLNQGFGVGGINPGINQVSPQIPISNSCRRWCRTPQGQAYCCETANQPTSLPLVKPGQCPPVRPQCPPTRFNLPPQQCSNDGACGGVDKCCFDTCLQHHTCKPPLGVGK